MALLVQFIISASAFVAGNTLWMVSFLFVPRCPTYVSSYLYKWGHAPVPCGSGPTVWGTTPRFWCGVRLSERRKSLSLVQGQNPGMGSGAPRSSYL